MREVLSRQLSVRQTEALANQRPRVEAPSAGSSGNPDTMALERHLAEQLGLRVKISFNGRGGFIQFYYNNLEQMDYLLSKIDAPTRIA